MHANSVGESMSNTCGYKNSPNLLRLQSQKLAYCKRGCVYMRVCTCQCVPVGKTLCTSKWQRVVHPKAMALST